jgi:hypothetical protein
MAQMIVHHKVRDYEAWRPGFDEHEGSRIAAGITNGRVFRGTDDPNDLLIILDVADIERARTWSQSNDLRSAMQRVGVVGPPAIHFVD